MGRVANLIQRNQWDELGDWVRSTGRGIRGEDSMHLSSELSQYDRLRRAPLFYAVAKKRAPASVVRMLIDRSPSSIMFANDIGGNTVIHAAAVNGNAEVLRVLLEHIAQERQRFLRRTNDMGWTPLMMAWKKFCDPTFKLFNRTPIHPSSSGRGPNIDILLTVENVSDLQQSEILHDLWNKTLLLCYYASDPSMKYPLFGLACSQPLHLLCRHEREMQVPSLALWVATRIYKAQLFQRDQTTNELPLHIICATPNWDEGLSDASESSIDLICRHCPQAARMKNLEGKLPLHLAIDSTKNMRHLRPLLDAYPEALEQLDPTLIVPPALQAACTRRTDLSTIFELVRLRPDLVTGGVCKKLTVLNALEWVAQGKRQRLR